MTQTRVLPAGAILQELCSYGLAMLATDSNATWCLQQLVSDLRSPQEVNCAATLSLTPVVVVLLLAFPTGHCSAVAFRSPVWPPVLAVWGFAAANLTRRGAVAGDR